MKFKQIVKNLLGSLLLTGMLVACSSENLSERVYNQGNNLLPIPVSVQKGIGNFVLNNQTTFYVSSTEAEKVADFYADKLRKSTGFNFDKSDTVGNNTIELRLDSVALKKELASNSCKMILSEGYI